MSIEFSTPISDVVEKLHKKTRINIPVSPIKYGMQENIDYIISGKGIMLNELAANALYLIAFKQNNFLIRSSLADDSTVLQKDIAIESVVDGISVGLKKAEGVYQLDDIYIGASKNLYKRIRDHFYNALSGNHPNSKLQFYIIKRILEGKRIKVKILSNNKCDELHFVLKRSERLPLLNKKSANFFSHKTP
nr:hypothetical protein [uncultured Arsenicibacter sp.]